MIYKILLLLSLNIYSSSLFDTIRDFNNYQEKKLCSSTQNESDSNFCSRALNNLDSEVNEMNQELILYSKRIAATNPGTARAEFGHQAQKINDDIGVIPEGLSKSRFKRMLRTGGTYSDTYLPYTANLILENCPSTLMDWKNSEPTCKMTKYLGPGVDLKKYSRSLYVKSNVLGLDLTIEETAVLASYKQYLFDRISMLGSRTSYYGLSSVDHLILNDSWSHLSHYKELQKCDMPHIPQDQSIKPVNIEFEIISFLTGLGIYSLSKNVLSALTKRLKSLGFSISKKLTKEALKKVLHSLSVKSLKSNLKLIRNIPKNLNIFQKSAQTSKSKISELIKSNKNISDDFLKSLNLNKKSSNPKKVKNLNLTKTKYDDLGVDDGSIYYGYDAVKLSGTVSGAADDLGYMTYDISDDVLEIGWIKVKQEYRKQGIQDLLIKKVLDSKPSIKKINTSLDEVNHTVLNNSIQNAFFQSKFMGTYDEFLKNLPKQELDEMVIKAIKETPAYRTRKKFNFDKIEKMQARVRTKRNGDTEVIVNFVASK